MVGQERIAFNFEESEPELAVFPVFLRIIDGERAALSARNGPAKFTTSCRNCPCSPGRSHHRLQPGRPCRGVSRRAMAVFALGSWHCPPR